MRKFVFNLRATLRSTLWRCGRRIYLFARRDLPRSPRVNGEYWLISKVVTEIVQPQPFFFDIGCCRGDWTVNVLTNLKMNGLQGKIHAFEPSIESFEYISRRFKSEAAVFSHQLAMSNNTGESDFFSLGTCVGINSMLPLPNAKLQRVKTKTVDDFLAEHNIPRVLFIKSDCEGVDLQIMRGAKNLLTEGRVDLWQFEYNHRWVDAGATLKDVFKFINGKPYKIGKLYSHGIELYSTWHPELERFFEANYVLVRKDSRAERFCTSAAFGRANAPKYVYSI